jgi:hypothetical protein
MMIELQTLEKGGLRLLMKIFCEINDESGRKEDPENPEDQHQCETEPDAYLMRVDRHRPRKPKPANAVRA